MPNKNPYDKISDRYERELQRALNLALLQVRGIYEDAILELSVVAAAVTAKEKPFALSLYPQLNREVERKLRRMHKSLLRLITATQKQAWELSSRKNTEIVDRRLAGKKPPGKVRLILYDPNRGALEAFLKRKEKGLDLSTRIWKALEPFRSELEQGLGLGISEGKGAAKMATELKRHLVEPDKLFRRVRGEDGKLRLSKKARAYKPGQGVYRSSYKNSLRLTRSETQYSYQSADYVRWQKLPFLKGIDVRLSNRHPVYDVCDEVKGLHPPDYKFTLRHPQCICHAVPVLISDEEYAKMESALLKGEELPPVSKIEDVPEAEKKWMRKNAERIKGWKQVPYFIGENDKYLGKYLKEKAVKK